MSNIAYSKENIKCYVGDAGPDLVWFTADDVMDCREHTYLDGTGKILRVYVNYPDDFHPAFYDNYTDYAYNPDNTINSTYYYVKYHYNECYTGKNGNNFEILYVDRYEYDTNGNRTYAYGYFNYDSQMNAASPDNRHLNSYTHFTYDASNRLIEEVTYRDKGADNTWFTADDTPYMFWYLKYTYDGLGNKLSEYVYSYGPDKLKNTGDDYIYMFTEYSYSGNIVKSYNAYPGPDGLPNTSDDNIRERKDAHYNASNTVDVIYYKITTIAYDPLTIWDMPIANIKYLENNVYNPDGSLLYEDIFRTSKGLDGTWITADDDIILYYQYIYK